MQKFLIPHKERKVKAFDADGEVSKEFLRKDKNIFFTVFMMVTQSHFILAWKGYRAKESVFEHASILRPIGIQQLFNFIISRTNQMSSKAFNGIELQIISPSEI